MLKSAVLSDDQLHRFQLRRVWDPKLPIMLWVMLNPSKADALQDDPTITKCIQFAKRHGYGGILVINLYSYRATKPADLWRTGDVCREETHYWIGRSLDQASQVILAWGANRPPASAVWTPRLHQMRIDIVLSQIDRRAYCFGRTERGDPRHPLMLSYSTPLQRYIRCH